MARAPCPGAGGASMGSSSIFGRWPRPRRFKPDSASRIASASPASSLAMRVSTLPRSMTMSRSGRRYRAWAWRRRLAVPSRPFWGKASKLFKFTLKNASRTSSRSGLAAIARPAGNTAGMSFREWMAQSMRPSSSASSISLVNRPLPPTSIRRRSWMRSPEVVMRTSGATSSTASCGASAPMPSAAAMRRCICPDWASASLEARVPMRTCCLVTVRRLPRALRWPPRRGRSPPRYSSAHAPATE